MNDRICVGPEGHVPHTLRIGADALTIVPCYRAPIPGFPDVTLFAEAAAAGNPCVGTLSQVYDGDESDALVPGPHARTMRARFVPPHPQAPRALIATFRTDDGTVHTGLMNITAPEMLPVTQVARLLDAWNAAVQTGQVTLSPGQPRKVTATTAPAYARRIRDAYRACVRECKTVSPTQKHFLDAHADAIGYTSPSGFDTRLKQLRKFGYSWPESYR